MVKIVEIKETLENTTLLDNIYAIDKIVKDIIKQTEFIEDLNIDDYNYINIILEKIKTNLKKANILIKKVWKYFKSKKIAFTKFKKSVIIKITNFLKGGD